MEAGLDTGPVFLERPVAIGPRETGGSLHDRLAAEGATAVLEVIDQLATNSASSIPQREDGVTYASKIDKSEALIDWGRSAVEIDRQVRAFNPWPIAETRLDGEQLRIYSAELVDDDHGVISGESDHKNGDLKQSGTIVDIRSDAIIVACGRGRLALTELQRPGRRPVAARDLLNTLNLAGRRLG
jgi:methionyl-tRNA formyltransferase